MLLWSIAMPEAGLSFGTTLACVVHHLMGIRKLRNLKVATTKSLNLSESNATDLYFLLFQQRVLTRLHRKAAML